MTAKTRLDQTHLKKYYMDTEIVSSQDDELPIYGVECADGILVPFGDLYLDMFPEQYNVE